MEGRLTAGSGAVLRPDTASNRPQTLIDGGADGPASTVVDAPGGVPIRAPIGLIAGSTGVRSTALTPDGSMAVAIGPDEAVVGVLPPLYPEWLGDRSFGAAHGC